MGIKLLAAGAVLISILISFVLYCCIKVGAEEDVRMEQNDRTNRKDDMDIHKE